jgi:hypothetical protein
LTAAVVGEEAVAEALDPEPGLGGAVQERGGAVGRLRGALAGAAQHHPVDRQVGLLGHQPQDGAAAADLDVVGVAPSASTRSGAPGSRASLRPSTASPLPERPGRVPRLVLGLEVLLVLEGVHRRPEPLVAVGEQQVLLDEALERLLDQLLPFADEVEDLLCAGSCSRR